MGLNAVVIWGCNAIRMSEAFLFHCVAHWNPLWIPHGVLSSSERPLDVFSQLAWMLCGHGVHRVPGMLCMMSCSQHSWTPAHWAHSSFTTWCRVGSSLDCVITLNVIVVSLDRIICCSLFGCTPGSQPSWLIHPTSLCCRCTLSAMDFLLISMAHHMCCICCWMDVTCVAPAVGDTDGFQEHLSTSENVIHWSILLSGHSATLCRVHSTLECCDCFLMTWIC